MAEGSDCRCEAGGPPVSQARLNLEPRSPVCEAGVSRADGRIPRDSAHPGAAVTNDQTWWLKTTECILSAFSRTDV